MEDLNKQQLILLVLLVSFVTSIATGIITVSLLDKAPVAVTQTVNRIVERTVETVVPDNLEQKDRVVTVRETVVVTEEDRVVDAISKNKGVIIRIFEGEVFVGIGFIQNSSGEIVTPYGDFNSLPQYVARFDSGEEIALRFLRDEQAEGVSYFQLETEKEKVFTFANITTEELQLGQTIVAITGKDTNSIATGRVTEVGKDNIVTDLQTVNFQVGTLLVNLSGDIVGIYDRFGQFISTAKFSTTGITKDDNANTAAVGNSVE